MTKRTLAVLITVNALLIAAVGVVSFTPQPAQAQLGGGGGDYLMLAGTAPGVTGEAVYIINVDTAKAIVLEFQRGAGAARINYLGGWDLNNEFGADAADVGGGK